MDVVLEGIESYIDNLSHGRVWSNRYSPIFYSVIHFMLERVMEGNIVILFGFWRSEDDDEGVWKEMSHMCLEQAFLDFLLIWVLSVQSFQSLLEE